MSGKTKIELPEPVEGVDYFIDVLERYTVSISIVVDGLAENTSESEICKKAIEGVKNGSLYVDSEVVSSEKIKDVELKKDGTPFNLAEWQKAKYAEMGLNEDGEALKPHEKERPRNESTLGSLFGR